MGSCRLSAASPRTLCNLRWSKPGRRPGATPVLERVLDEISYSATDRSGETVAIDAAYVQKHVGDLAKNADLSKFIL